MHYNMPLAAGSLVSRWVRQPTRADVMFTGSTEVARLIQARLSERLSAADKPIPQLLTS